MDEDKGWGWDEGQTFQVEGTVRPEKTDGPCVAQELWAGGGGAGSGTVGTLPGATGFLPVHTMF